MPLVQLPDGQRLQFPDDMSEPDMAAAISKNFPQFAPEKSEGILDRAQDAYHAVKDELTPKPDVSDLATTASKTATVPGADAIHVGDNGLPSFSSDRQMDIGVDNAVKSASTPTPPIQSQLAQNQNSDEAALGYLNSDKNLSEDDKVQDASRGIIDHARPYVDKSISDTLNEIPKGLAEVGDDLGLSGALATSTIAKPMDWAYQYFTNNPDTPVQDAVFRNLADPFLQGKENNAVDQDTGFGGKLAHTVGGLGGMMIEGFTTGGAALEKNLAEGISKALIETGQHAFAGMALPAATAAVDIGRQVYEKTGDMTQASNAMAATALTTVAAGAFPMSAGGKLAQRMATGAVTMPIVNEATHPFEQSALPDSMKSDRTWQDRMLDMVTGAGFASLPHAHAPEFTADRAQQLREQMGYKPDTELQPLADQKESLINEIKSDPLNSVKAISDAPTVEDAIKAANEITTRPVETPKGFENVIDQTIADTVTPDENKVEPTVDYKVDEPAKIITPIDNRVESKPEDITAIEKGINKAHVDNLNKQIAKDNIQRAKDGLPPKELIKSPDDLGTNAYDIKEVEPGALSARFSPDTRRTVELIAAAFGKKVKYIADAAGKKLFFRGAYGGEIGADENTIYLDAASNHTALSVVGHEIGHALKTQAGDLYAKLEDHLFGTKDENGNVTSEGALDKNIARDNFVNRGYGKLGEKKADVEKKLDTPLSTARQETVSDVIGDKLNDTQFLTDLALRMSTPEANTFLTTVRDAVVKAVNVVKGKLLSKQTKSSLDKAHEAILEAMAEYKRRLDSGAIEGAKSDGEISFGRKEDVGDYQFERNKDGSMWVHGDPEEIRSAIPDDVKGRVQDGKILFTHSDAPRVRAALEGRGTAYSRAGHVIDKLPMKDGKYIGAPEKFDTPAKITHLRKWLTQLTKEGERGRYWYENSSHAVLQMVGHDVNEARKFVALLAIYSPQAKVDTNSTFALRAWAQYKAGQEINVKTGVMDTKAKEALDEVDKFWSGEKTGNFFTNLLRMIDPNTKDHQGATIDIWMMRAAHYKTDAPSNTQYAFMENETNRIAKEMGWEPQQVQAAVWVAMKARMENKDVKKSTEESSAKKGWISYKTGAKGKPVRVIHNEEAHRANWLKHAFEHDPTTDDTTAAKFDFADGLRRHIGQVSFEARPGRTSGILSGIHDAEYAKQVEYQQAFQKALYGPQGEDLIAQKLGLLVDGERIEPGVWENEVSPSSQKNIPMAPDMGKEGQTHVDPSQKKMMNLYSSILGLLGKQEGVGWHRPFYNGNKSGENGLLLDIGRSLTPDEAKQLVSNVGEWMHSKGKDTFVDWEGKTQTWDKGLAFIADAQGKGMRVVNFGALDNKELRQIAEVAKTSLPDVKGGTFTSDGDMPSNNWKDNPNGQAYVDRITAEGSPDLLRWVRDELAPRVQRVNEEFSKKYGWGDPGEISFSRNEDEGTKYADSESIPRDKLSGRKVTVPYLIRDTGETAHMKMDAKEELDNLDSREDAMKRLEDCLA